LNPPHPSRIPLAEFGVSKDSLDRAVLVVKEAIERGAPIIIYGDYDVDGITATAILWETIYCDLGYKKCRPFIPNRFEHGYGLSKAAVDEIRHSEFISESDGSRQTLKQVQGADGQVQSLHRTGFGDDEHPLLITVDCGITAHEAIEYARSLGMEVLVTDHHQKGGTNGSGKESDSRWRQETDSFSILWTDKICGAGIAYLLASRLAEQQGSWAGGKLELAGLATIADIEPLVGPNRSFVKYGLEQLNKTSRVGLQELIKSAGEDGQTLGVYEAGWVISPRLNAAGRLGSAIDALRLLCTKDRVQARKLALKLDRINRERQDKTEEMAQSALHTVRNAIRMAKVVVVSHESYHEGIIGLLAGKLVREFYRPVVAISKGSEFSKGSARSITGFNIVEALRDTSNLLEDLGGHPMAAGFTIRTERIAKFEKRLLELGERSIDDKLLRPVLKVDLEIPLSLVSWDLWKAVSQFEPFGCANPRPLFLSRAVGVVDAVAVGKDGKHLKLKLQDISGKPPSNSLGSVFSAIGFGLGEWAGRIGLGDTIDVVYNISENNWNGRRSLELNIKDLKGSAGSEEPPDQARG